MIYLCNAQASMLEMMRRLLLHFEVSPPPTPEPISAEWVTEAATALIRSDEDDVDDDDDELDDGFEAQFGEMRLQVEV